MIDEWQEVPSLWDAVRAEVDRHRKVGQFILTGSSTPHRKGILHSGTGRIVTVRMSTMTLYETGDSDGCVSLEKLCRGELDTRLLQEVALEDLAYFIIRGGFPDNLHVSRTKAHMMPRAYMENVIKEDLNRLDNSLDYNIQKTRLLLKSLARNESTTASDLSVLKDITATDVASISRNTMAKYMMAFDRLFLLSNQEPFSSNIRSGLRVKQAEKRHFADPSMAAALLNLTEEKLMGDLNTFGFLFEALVEHDLGVYAQSFGGRLFHYQDYANHEIDAIIEMEDGTWAAFEIKLGAKKIDEGAENLNKACDGIIKNGGKAPAVKCVISGLSNAAYIRKDGVFVVPVTALKN